MSAPVRDPIAGAGRAAAPPRDSGAAQRTTPIAWTILGLSAIGWAALAWMAVDMGHPLVQLTMPPSSDWSAANLLLIWSMWAVMMAAMMLPSALPMVLAFVRASRRDEAGLRSVAFVSTYLLVWSGFSVLATAVQWALQALDLVNPMIVSSSAALSAVLLLLAGVYQFSALKRTCLARCRTPIGFMLGEWRGGTSGGFVMGLRHGLFCLGCCWALMALLFVGGVMNLAWVAALAVAAAIEKLAPQGRLIANVLGLGLIIAGSARVVVVLMT